MTKQPEPSLPRYPAKIMLVGEYGVVAGGEALTLPFPVFGARVRKTADASPGEESSVEQSQHHLRAILDYLRNLPPDAFRVRPDLDRFQRDMEDYWLEVDIPVGYGLGSSGAVSAALYDMFFPGSRDLDLAGQKKDLGRIEGYFHGTSSGVDPLTCYSGQPLHFRDDGRVDPVAFPDPARPSEYRFFLLDTGETHDTRLFVTHFLEQMKDDAYLKRIREEYLPLNRKLIRILLGEDAGDPAMVLAMISDFQYQAFRRMIPDPMVDLWLEGLVSHQFYLKLNGSGGGYLLGICHADSADGLEARFGDDLLWVL